MAQQRLRDYQSPLGSFLHNLANLGIHSAGRFCGFDTLIVTGQLQFSLAHTTSGINTFDIPGNPYGPLAVVMSNQGEILLEDAPITGLQIDTNLGNVNPRIDLVVLNHQYIQLANPAAANYSIVKGSMVSNTPGALAAFQTIIGTILIPAGATLISQCTWVKAKCPDSGDQPDAKLNVPNVFTVTNSQSSSSKVYTQPDAFDPVNGFSMYDLASDGNLYKFTPQANITVDCMRILNMLPNQDGSEITLLINSFVKLRAGLVPTDPSSALGYSPILFSNRLTTNIESVNGVLVNVMQPPASDPSFWFVTMVKTFNIWQVKGVEGLNFNPNGFKKGMCIEVQMALADVPNYWDANGTGISDWFGWQLSNGYKNTIDKRGIVHSVMATDAPSASSPLLNPRVLPLGKAVLSIGDTGGALTHKLIGQELPAIQIKIVDADGNPYVNDTNGGGALKSIKGDNDNSLANGYIQTAALGQGAAIDIANNYVVTLFAVKL